MRYTTIIDISENAKLYENKNAVLLYLHLCLKCGYRDSDRDIFFSSIRKLAADLNITVSACRHSLMLLDKFKLIEYNANYIKVKKYVESESITPREKDNKTKKIKEERERIQNESREQEDKEKKERQALYRQGKTPYMEYFERMQAEARAYKTDKAIFIINKKENIEHYNRDKEWIYNIIDEYKKGSEKAKKILYG